MFIIIFFYFTNFQILKLKNNKNLTKITFINYHLINFHMYIKIKT